MRYTIFMLLGMEGNREWGNREIGNKYGGKAIFISSLDISSGE